MRQYDLCRLRRGDNYVVLLQSDLVDGLDTRVVAPVVKLDQLPPLGRMRPTVQLHGESYRVAMDRLAAIPRRDIGEAVRSLSTQQDELKNAMDTIFFGF